MQSDVKYHDEKYNYDGTARSEAEFKARVAERKKKEEKEREEYQKKVDESNKILLDVPPDLNEKEKAVWMEFTNILIEGSNRIKTTADKEIIRQYVYLVILRDNAWLEWSKNPELYIRIVTGVDKDGKTPKVTIKENQNYAIFTESNKQIEKILDDFKLSYKTRN